MTPAELVVVLVAVVLATFLQASIGFGMGMLAAPIVALVDPTLVPATIIMLATTVTTVVALRERASVNLRGLGWSLIGRLPGTVAGTVLVVVLSGAALSLLVAGVVLTGVLASRGGRMPALRRRNLVLAGTASGIMGTATSIGGSPMAFVFQRAQAAEIRGTLNAFFLVGSVVSLLSLAAAGAIEWHNLTTYAALVPGVAVGYVLSRFVVRHLDRRRIRTIAIVASTIGAVALIVREVVRLLS